MSRKKQLQSPAPDSSSSANGNSKSEEPYSVGFCRPPRHSQFRPGQSGNPKGRAKESQNPRTIIKLFCNEKMQIREGGRVRSITKFEALLHQMFSRAFKGDSRACASIMVFMKYSGYGDDHNETATDILLGSQFQEISADFLERHLPQVPKVPLPQGVESEISAEQASSKREGNS